MAITELTTLKLIPPHTFQSMELCNILTTLCARQCAFSAYPVALYADISSSTTFYLLSGWRNVVAMSLWRSQNSTLETLASLQAFMTIPQTVLVDMNFDTIPRGGNVLCWVRHWVQQEDGGDGDGGEMGTVVPTRVEWIGGGHGVGDEEARRMFHRFIMYDEETSRDAIRGSRNAIAMKRVSIPRPPVLR